MIYLALVTAVLLALTLFYVNERYGRKGRIVGALPGPGVTPVLGNVLFHKSFVELYQILRDWGNEFYPVYRLWFASIALIIIRHPDDFEVLFNSTKVIDKNFGYDFIRPWLRNGLVLAGGERWHQRRKILTPAFHFDILKKYLDITREQGEKAVVFLKSQGDQTVQDLRNFCSEYTLNIICESAMGVSLDPSDTGAVRYREALHKMINIIFYRLKRPFIMDWMLHFMPKLKKETAEVVADLDNFIDSIVRKRREYHMSTNNEFLKNLENNLDNSSGSESDSIYFTSSGKKKRLAMLDLLLAAEQRGLIDDAGIKEEVATFVFEGHDTTAITMMYTLMLLAENEDAQREAREEVTRIMDAKDGVLETSDLQEMRYLDRVIKESLRLFPAVPAVGRYVSEDLKFKIFMAPVGSHLSLQIVDAHRDPNFWPEPEKFDPDRFLPEQVAGRHPFSYVPFSAGSRNCIGQKFAMMELKSLLGQILYNFNLEPVDHTRDVKIMADLVLRPSHPLRIKFVKLKNVLCTKL